MDGLGGRQVAFNESSRGQWHAFAEHRRHVTALLCRDASASRSRLCVLGVGNANDLHLPDLLAAYREVHLVDIDGEALAVGASRQGVASDPRLHLHGGIDVTATLDVLSNWTRITEIRAADLAALADWPATRLAAILPGGFDRIASTCLLSQILETASHVIGRSHPQLAKVEAALRAGHLRLMTRLASMGGEAVLVAEVASTDMLPGLTDLPDEELAGVLRTLGRSGNHFRGVRPGQLLEALRDDPYLAPCVTAATPLAPWRWRLHDRTYLVAGLSFRIGTR